jgi:hypothetical protein
MEKNTKILIGVGIAAVAAYFVYRNKKSGKSGSTTGNGKKCPEGFVYSQINCIQAPCPEGECVPLESIPEEILPPIFQPKPKPLPKPVSSKCPAGSSEQVVMCIKAPCPSICFDNKTGDMVRPINDENDYDSEYREPVDLGKNPRYLPKPNPFTGELFNQMPIYLQK